MKYLYYLSLFFFLTSCYSLKYQDGYTPDNFSTICDNIVYLKRSTVKREQYVIDTVKYFDNLGVYSGKYGLEIDTIFYSDKIFQYHKLLALERLKFNDPDIIITNLIWDYKQDLRWLLFKYKSIEAVSFDVIKCKSENK